MGEAGQCQNCNEPNTQSRPINFEGYSGTEFYCPKCPPEKWSKVVVETVTPESKLLWNDIFENLYKARRG